MNIHRIELFAVRPGELPAITPAAAAVCPLPCAVQTFQLSGDDGTRIEAHVVWENRSRGLAKMAFIPPPAPAWAEQAVLELIARNGEASTFNV